MELDIHEGKRVLYRQNGQWNIGELTEAHMTKLTKDGLYLSIIPKESIGEEKPILHDAEFNDIFFDAVLVEDYFKDYHDMFMTKEEYIDFIGSEDFLKAAEQAYVSDGEYYYYKVNKFTRNWLEKQPFDYIVRLN